MKLYFNTSRMYARDGQLIYATFEDDVVHFDDYSRMISGQFECHLIVGSFAADTFARLVMKHYDACDYEWAPTRERPDMTPVEMKL